MDRLKSGVGPDEEERRSAQENGQCHFPRKKFVYRFRGNSQADEIGAADRCPKEHAGRFPRSRTDDRNEDKSDHDQKNNPDHPCALLFHISGNIFGRFGIVSEKIEPSFSGGESPGDTGRREEVIAVQPHSERVREELVPENGHDWEVDTPQAGPLPGLW